MAKFVLLFTAIAYTTNNHGKYEQYLKNTNKHNSFSKLNALDKFKEFKGHAKNMTKRSNRGSKDIERDNIKRGFELFNNYTKITGGDLHNKSDVAKEAVETLGYILNKDVLAESRNALPVGERKQFDKTISKEGAKSRREFAKTLMSGKKEEKTFVTDSIKLFVKRQDRDKLLNKTLSILGGAGAFKIPIATKSKLPPQATAVVHELNEGEGHWGRDANKFKIKSRVIGMQLVSDNGNEIEIKNLTQKISIRFVNITSDVVGKCGWWDVNLGEWSLNGCTRTATPPKDGLGAECMCNHLTEFAIVQEVTANNTQPEEESSSEASELGIGLGVGVPSVLAVGYFGFVRSPNAAFG